MYTFKGLHACSTSDVLCTSLLTDAQLDEMTACIKILEKDIANLKGYVATFRE